MVQAVSECPCLSFVPPAVMAGGAESRRFKFPHRGSGGGSRCGAPRSCPRTHEGARRGHLRLSAPSSADVPFSAQLLDYVMTTLLFSDKNVDSNLITWNRVVLLHGKARGAPCDETSCATSGFARTSVPRGFSASVWGGRWCPRVLLHEASAAHFAMAFAATWPPASAPWLLPMLNFAVNSSLQLHKLPGLEIASRFLVAFSEPRL